MILELLGENTLNENEKDSVKENYDKIKAI